MTTYTLPITADHGYALATDHVLHMAGAYNRFGVGCIARDKAGRRKMGGEPVPGPYAFAFGLSTCITADPEMSTGAEIRRNLAAGREHTVHEGDEVIIDEVRYRVRFSDGFGGRHGRLEFIQLDLVEDLNPAKTAELRPAAEADAARMVAVAEALRVAEEETSRQRRIAYEVEKNRKAERKAKRELNAGLRAEGKMPPARKRASR